MRKWNKEQFGICNLRIKMLRDLIYEVQQKDPSALNMLLEENLKEIGGMVKERGDFFLLLVSYTRTQWVLNPRPHTLHLAKGRCAN